MYIDEDYLAAMRDDMLEEGYDADFIEEVLREFRKCAKEGKPFDIDY